MGLVTLDAIRPQRLSETVCVFASALVAYGAEAARDLPFDYLCAELADRHHFECPLRKFLI